jgi:Immunity protein Imm1
VVWVRLALAAFVLLWVFDVLGVQGTVPVWVPFLIGLGLELNFFLGARSTAPIERSRGRSPLEIDRARYGYANEPEELVLVRDGERELWIPYSGESPAELDALIDSAADEDDVDDEDAGDEIALEAPPRIRRLAVGIGLLAALAALVWVAGNRGWESLDSDERAAATARFSSEASRIVGRPVDIRCDQEGKFVGAVQHADGVAEVGGRIAYLTPQICHNLYRLAFEDDVGFNRTAHALVVLAHEAWHLHGERDEGRTECFALQSAVGLGQRLGLTEETARRMMRQQLVENQLRARGSLEYLVPAACRDGGELDLHPNTTAFP